VVDRPVQFEDTIEIDIHCKQGERTLLNRQDAEYAVHEGHKYPAPGFAEKLIGLKKGEETEFTLSFPEDYHIKEVAGNQYDFKVKIKEVKGKALPELNDEFAKTVGSDNVVTLRESIKTRLQKHTDDGLKKEFANKLLAKLVEQSTIEFPPVLVENEINRILKEESQKFPDGLTGLQNSLVNLNKTLEQHREDLRPTAVNRVKGYLVASKIAELENVAVADEEVDGMVDTMSTGEDGTDEKLKALFNLPQSRASLRDMLYIIKAMILLTKIATGQDTQ
jgi:trigger factor